MKAIVHDEYGSPDDLELREVDVPTVADDGVLVRIRASSVNAYDWHMMRGLPYLVRIGQGLRRPRDRMLGVDLAGEVEAVGRNVTQFRTGEQVFGARAGAFAEYVCVPESKYLVPKPPGLTFEQAASMPLAGTTAIQALRDAGKLQAGQRVLINGAAGGVGTFAVQIAKALGADVTGVCSTRNVEMVRSIGADHVIDHTAEDFTRPAERYDLILEAVGNRSLSELRRALNPRGTLVLVGGGHGRWLGPLAMPIRATLLSRFVDQKLQMFLAQFTKADLLALKEMVEAGKISPVIDRAYPLSATPEAIRYVETGHARGKAVISVQAGSA